MILKTAKRWPSLLGLTHGGADFNRPQTYTTSLSGIKLSYQFPTSAVGKFDFKKGPSYFDISQSHEIENIQLATRFFQGACIASDTWWYRGSWFKHGIQSIGYMTMEWQVVPVKKDYPLNDIQTDSMIHYLKQLIDATYEEEGGLNYQIRQSCHDFYVENGGYPVEHYAEDIQKDIERESIKHPDDYQVVLIHGNEWIRFSTNESRRAIFHVLPLNTGYLLINMGQFFYDCSDEKKRWEHEGIKIIETVMNSTRVDFP
ncbi:hypothetical protein [Aliikangiella sp. IMCC44359]|uniref:hypothetical protein n=1 Tax=Aliikangiella sp. IMCC44359 TaxID=3459125 RepID=UPI00403A9F30